MSPRWSASLLVLGFAAIVRLPHYDVAWFGYDQVKFMFQARRVLSGHWDVIGPDASGLDIIGPLYSYLLAGLLWLRDDPGFLVLFGVTCDVVAAWFVYDVARRLSGPIAGFVAAITYTTVPTLVIGTRLLWNPTLLPLVVALGWWLALRYCDSPSTRKLIGVAFVCGLTLPLHATGVFHAAGLMLAVIVARPPSLPQLAAALVATVLPLVPVLPRVIGTASDVSTLGGRIAAPTDVLAILDGLAVMTLSFPKAFGQGRLAELSSLVLHLQAAVAGLGLVIGLTRRGPYWPIWLGLAVSVVLELVAATFYSAAISWHYFLALIPAACVWIGQATLAFPQARLVAATLMVAMAATHLLFVDDFDRTAIASGLIRVETQYIARPANVAVGYAPTLRYLRTIGHAAQKVAPDGPTAMLVSHGGRAELWRETGAEFMTPAAGPRDGWKSEFLLMGPGATPLRSDARIVDEHVCAFDRSPLPWRSYNGTAPARWEHPQFADADWAPLGLPRRITGPSLTGPGALATWRPPLLYLRGSVNATTPLGRRAFGVSIRGVGFSHHWIAGAFVNGVPIDGIRDRVLLSSLSMTHEWFIDLTGRLDAGENVIALAIDGQVPAFDLDVFDVPCLDTEWYY